MTFDQAGKRKIDGLSVFIHTFNTGNPAALAYEGDGGGVPNLMNERYEV